MTEEKSLRDVPSLNLDLPEGHVHIWKESLQGMDRTEDRSTESGSAGVGSDTSPASDSESGVPAV